MLHYDSCQSLSPTPHSTPGVSRACIVAPDDKSIPIHTPQTSTNPFPSVFPQLSTESHSVGGVRRRKLKGTNTSWVGSTRFHEFSHAHKYSHWPTHISSYYVCMYLSTVRSIHCVCMDPSTHSLSIHTHIQTFIYAYVHASVHSPIYLSTSLSHS